MTDAHVMGLLGKKQALGLDMGQSAVKAVRLGLAGKDEVVVLGTNHLDCRAEGILNDAELFSHLGTWLTGIGWLDAEATVGVPQFLATTQTADFPEGVTKNLAELVAFETQQLSGLSEDAFLHGFHHIGPLHGRRNAVLIGVCRQSVIEERAEALMAAGVQLVDLGMNGIALANAYFDLYPEVAAADEPVLLLDLGADTSTLVVTAASQVLFISSLAFGSNRFNQAIARHLNVSEEQAEKVKLGLQLTPQDGTSPLQQALRLLENEVRTAVEHWRSQERAAIATKHFAKLCVCGGGAKLAGLVTHLAKAQGCPGEMVGLPIAADGGPQRDPTLQDLDGHRIRLSLAPELMIAYGLALQGLGRQRVRLSLAPERIRWVARRRRQFPLLALGCALAFVLAGAFLFRTYLQLTDERKSLEARGEEIGKCENVIPRLEELQRGIRHREKMLVPIVAKASRARRFQETVNRLAEARGADDWFIYLADQESYQAGRSKEEVAKSRAVGPGSPAAAGAGMMLMPRPGGTSPDPDVPDAFPLRVQAEQVAPLDVLIAALYTRWQQKDPYAPVKEIVSKLNATTAANSFKEVDILPPSERTGREDIFLPWQNYFKNLPPEPSYRPFLLRIPFAELEINPQVAAQETREGGR